MASLRERKFEEWWSSLPEGVIVDERLLARAWDEGWKISLEEELAYQKKMWK